MDEIEETLAQDGIAAQLKEVKREARLSHEAIILKDDRWGAEERAMADWSQEFREQNSADFPNPMELQGVIDSNLRNWRQQWRERKPKLTIVGRDQHVADLRRRIAALQHDLRMFEQTHGSEPDLDQRVVDWLKALSTE
jgi:hypothetical protein